VGLYRRTTEGALERYARVETDVEGPRTVVADLAGAEAPELVLVNDDDLTYCKIRFDDTSLATLLEHLGALTDPLARALCWSALWNMTRDALLPARDFVGLVLRFAGRESDIGVLQMLHAWANSALVHYAAPEWRQTGGELLAQGALRELEAAEPGSEHQLAWARFFATVASGETDLALLKRLLDGAESIDGLEVDQELRWAFLEPLAAHGVADESVLAAELARDDTASGKRHQVRCLAARPSAAVKAQAWAQVVESDALSNALVEATIAGFAQPSQRELTAPYAEKYFAAIERVWRERSIQIGMDVVRGLFPALQDRPETLEATDAWLQAHRDAAPALRRLVLEARDDLARALRAQECDATALGD
jgi:aminopeptidase N